MAELQPGVWGIDIGQCALKALRLELVDGQVAATAFDYVEHPKILSQPDADPDQLTREALEKFLSRNTLRGDVVAVSVPGQSGLARFVKLPPVEERKIPDIVRFEAKQQIPFPLDEVVWDYQKIGSGAVTDGFAMETEIGLFAIKRDMVNRALQQFKDVNIEVHLIQMAPLALCNFLSYDLLQKGGPPADDEGGDEKPKAKPGDKQCVVALDIGTDNSNLVITDGEKVIWQRPIPFGGNHFTRALTKDLKLTFAKAEHLKRNATKSPDLKKILTALKPVLNDFVGEVQRSLGYFTNTHRNANIAYLVGLGNAFRLPGLQKFLSEKLQIEVRKLGKLERLEGDGVTAAPAFTQNVMSFASAYGLALQGLKLARLQTNLLPQEIQFERMVRAKKPWAVAAAASLLVGTLAATVCYSVKYHAVAAASVVDEIGKSKPVVKAADDDKKAYDAVLASVKTKEEEVRKVSAGQEERLNWILLSEYINECLPAPGQRIDGKVKARQGNRYLVTDRGGRDAEFDFNDTLVMADGKEVGLNDLKEGKEVSVVSNTLLPPQIKQRYWTKDAMRAYYRLGEKQAGSRGDKGLDLGLKHLVQVNVESVYPVFSGDLSAYYTQLQAAVKEKGENYLKEMLTEDDLKNPPKDKGWVVELRGYTYHDQPLKFLLETLHHNLATRAQKRGKAAAAESKEAPAAAKPPDKPATPVAENEADQLFNNIIADKIKCVVIFNYTTADALSQEAGNFVLINSSVVGQLVPAAAATGTAPTGGSGERMPARSGVPTADVRGSAGGTSGGFQPLAPIDAGGGNAAGPMHPGPIPRRPMAGRLPREGGPPVLATPNPPTEPAPAAEKDRVGRTEFIILFVWYEPIKTSFADAAAGGTTQTYQGSYPSKQMAPPPPPR